MNHVIFEELYDLLAYDIAEQLLKTLENAKNRLTTKTFEYFEPLEFTLILKMKTLEHFEPTKTKHFSRLPWEILNFESKGFAIDSNSYLTTDNRSEIELIVYISSKSTPQGKLFLYWKLIDDIRHEIEHLLQTGPNQKRGHKVKLDRRAKDASPFQYFLLDEEIPAMVSGMRASSLKRGVPARIEFEEYLRPFLQFGIITDAEQSTILETWTKFLNSNETSK